MTLSKRYDPSTEETRTRSFWEESGAYRFFEDSTRPVFSIDTPPATVSGKLHLGHVYSYCQPDFIARFWRMRGHNVFYPMGYDDNGLPTERLVEKKTGLTAATAGRAAFIEACRKVSLEAEEEYEALWRRLGISIDWRFRYRTIDPNSQRAAQWSFLDLYRKGRIYRDRAPTIWCPECQTSIAQAELDDVEWQRSHNLPIKEAIGPDGRLTDLAGPFAGLTAAKGRRETIRTLRERQRLISTEKIRQSAPIHERCDTPVEYRVTRQWFIRILDRKDEFLDAGEKSTGVRLT